MDGDIGNGRVDLEWSAHVDGDIGLVGLIDVVGPHE